MVPPAVCSRIWPLTPGKLKTVYTRMSAYCNEIFVYSDWSSTVHNLVLKVEQWDFLKRWSSTKYQVSLLCNLWMQQISLPTCIISRASIKDEVPLLVLSGEAVIGSRLMKANFIMWFFFVSFCSWCQKEVFTNFFLISSWVTCSCFLPAKSVFYDVLCEARSQCSQCSRGPQILKHSPQVCHVVLTRCQDVLHMSDC